MAERVISAVSTIYLLLTKALCYSICESLDPLPDGHEGEAQEQPQDAPHLSHQGGQGVQQLLTLHQDEGGSVPQDQARITKVFLKNTFKYCLLYDKSDQGVSVWPQPVLCVGAGGKAACSLGNVLKNHLFG